MNPSIQERLSRAEEEFIEAVAHGGSALAVFDGAWSALLDDIDHAVQNNSIDSETMVIGNLVASRVAILSDSLIEMQSSADAIQDDLEDTFARVNLNEITIDGRTSVESHLTPESLYTSSTHENVRSTTVQPVDLLHALPNNTSLYIESAYRWLLDNLYNPYPSKEQRATISRDSGCPSKLIDAWFIDARKRIGWNSLRKKHFCNKRACTIDAATRFFVAAEDAQRPLELEPEVELALAGMQATAKDMYSSKFGESVLATKLDQAVKDMTPETKAQERQRGQQLRAAARRAQRAYPSPEPESPATQSEDEADAAVAAAGQKRASDSSDDVMQDRASKRTRTDALPTGLPSPASSLHESLQPTPSAAVSGRKRRLTDADSQGLPKRPCTLPVGPRVHVAVSDPFPMSTAVSDPSVFSDWFQNNFELPHGVTTDELLLDIELFQFPTLQGEAEFDTNSLTALEPSSSQLFQQIAPAATEESSLPTSTEISHEDHFNFTDLLAFSPPTQQPASDSSLTDLLNQDVGTPETPSLEFDPLSNAFGSFTSSYPNGAPDTVTIADYQQLVSADPASNLDYLLSFIPTYDAGDKYQDFGLGHMPELGFDAALVGLGDPLLAPLATNLVWVDRVAKQRQLMEMKEATRRLEEELAAS